MYSSQFLFKAFVLSILLFITSTSISQVNKAHIDSLIAYLESDAVEVDDFDLTDKLCNEIETKSLDINYEEGFFVANLISAQVYRSFSFAKVEPFFDKLDSIYSNPNHNIPPTRVIEYLLAKGYTSGSNGNLRQELNCYLLADSITNTIDLKEYRIYVDQHIANFYLVNEEYEKALSTLKHIVNNYDGVGQDFDYSIALQVANVGIVFSYLKEYDSTVYYIQKSIEMGLGQYIDLHYQYLTIAEAYLNLNDMDSTQKYIGITEDLYNDSYYYSVDIVNFNMVKGHYFAKLKEFEKANVYYKKALVDSDSLNYINGLSVANAQIVLTTLKQNNQLDVLANFENYKSANDTITNRANLKNEQQHLVQFETLQKESEIIELKLKNRIETERKWFYAAVLTSVVLILLILLLRFRNNQIKLKQKLKLENLEKERVEKELEYKENELTLKINNLQQNAKIIDELKKSNKTEENINEMIKAFDQNYITENQWRKIILQFENIHDSFIPELKNNIENLSNNDIKLAILTKLKYSNTGMSEVLNISTDGVKKAKQRLKKKLSDTHFVSVLF